MKFTAETKLFLGIILATAAIIAGAVFLLSKPAPTISRDLLVPKDAAIRGNPGAKTYLVEFSDFQCPACAAAKPAVDQIINAHKDNLLFVYRHFPLDQHPFAVKAAIAAEAAKKQGKFWEMYDLLFANQDRFADSVFADLAKQLQLDPTRFANDVSDPALGSTVLSDRTAGEGFGVSATPTFFLNGKKLDLASFDDLKKEVEKAVQ